MSGHYLVYLLRIWPVSDRQHPDLRVMLEDPRTHSAVGFTSLEELHQYLCLLEQGNWEGQQNANDEMG